MARWLRAWAPKGTTRYINADQVAHIDVVMDKDNPSRMAYGEAYNAKGTNIGRIVDTDAEALIEDGRTVLPDHTGSAILLYFDFEDGEMVHKERWPVVGWRVPDGGKMDGAWPITNADLGAVNCWWVVEVWQGSKPTIWSRPHEFDAASLEEAEKHFEEWLAKRRHKAA